MKYDDINKEFNARVQTYMQLGFVINTPTMDKAKTSSIVEVDMVREGNLMRIGLYREWTSIGKWSGNVVVLRVYIADCKPMIKGGTVCKEFTNAEVCSGKIYYEVERDHWYVDTLEEAMRCQDLKYDRLVNRSVFERTHFSDVYPQSAEVARRYLEKRLGYEVNPDHVFVTKKSFSATSKAYYINYMSDSYLLR